MSVPMQSYTNGKATAAMFNLGGQSYSVRPGESIDGPIAYAKFYARQGLRPAASPQPAAPAPDPVLDTAPPTLPGIDEAPAEEKPPKKKRGKGKGKSGDKSEG